MKLNDGLYDVLKWLCIIILPAVSVLYASLDGVFGWGYTEAVTTVIAAIETFLGAIIGESTVGYNKTK